MVHNIDLDAPLQPVEEMTMQELLDEISYFQNLRNKKAATRAKVTQKKRVTKTKIENLELLRSVPDEKLPALAEKLGIDVEALREMLSEED